MVPPVLAMQQSACTHYAAKVLPLPTWYVAPMHILCNKTAQQLARALKPQHVLNCTCLCTSHVPQHRQEPSHCDGIESLPGARPTTQSNNVAGIDSWPGGDFTVTPDLRGWGIRTQAGPLGTFMSPRLAGYRPDCNGVLNQYYRLYCTASQAQ